MTVEVVLLRPGGGEEVVDHPRPLPVGGVVEAGDELWRVLLREASERADASARYVCAPLGEARGSRSRGARSLSWHPTPPHARHGIEPGVPLN